jgi:TolB-like protein
MRRLTLLSLCLLLCGYGCGPRVATSARGEQRISPGSLVAVLPFENLSGRENASEKITEYFILSLRRIEGLKVAEFGQTYELLRRHRVRSATFLTDAQVDSLAAGLGASYIIAGSVLEFTETNNQYLGEIPEVSLNVRMISCASRKTVWSGVVNSRGDQSEVLFGIGAVRSKEELALRAVDETVDKIGELVGQ